MAWAEMADRGFGNPAVYQFSETVEIGGDRRSVGMGFTLPEDGLGVGKAFVEVMSVQGGGLPVRVGFQSADGDPESGRVQPSGTWLDGKFAQAVLKDAGVVEIAFPEEAKLPGDVPVFLVIEAAEPSAGGTAKVRLGSSERAVELIDDAVNWRDVPRLRPDGTTDPHYGIHTGDPDADASSWKAYAPIFLMEDGGGRLFGNPYGPGPILSLRSPEQVLAQRFVVPADGGPVRFSEAVLLARYTSASGRPCELSVVVEEEGTGAAVTEGRLAFEEPTPSRHVGGEFYVVKMNGVCELQPGKGYRLVLRAPELLAGESIQFAVRGVSRDWLARVPQLAAWRDTGIARGAVMASRDGEAFKEQPEGEWSNLLFVLR